MKTTRRIFSMVLALMMVLSLSVTAFADTTATVNVVIHSRTGENVTKQFAINTTGSLYDNLKTSKEVTTSWHQVSDWEDPEVKHYVMDDLDGYGTIVFNHEDETDIANLAAKNYDASKLNWIESMPGYVDLGYNAETGLYKYMYVGYAWVYSSNAVAGEIEDYMCCYNPQAGETITLTYDLQISIWESEYSMT